MTASIDTPQYVRAHQNYLFQTVVEAVKASDEVSALMVIHRRDPDRMRFCCCCLYIDPENKNSRKAHGQLMKRIIHPFPRNHLIKIHELINNNREEIINQIEIRSWKRMRNILVILTIILFVCACFVAKNGDENQNTVDRIYKRVALPIIALASLSMIFSPSSSDALLGIKRLQAVVKHSAFNAEGKLTLQQWFDLYVANCDKTPPKILDDTKTK